MSEETGPGHESYLTGGNLLNEQDRIARAKEYHTGGDAHPADPVEDGATGDDDGDVADEGDRRPGSGSGGEPASTSPEEPAETPGEEPADTPGEDDDVEQPVPGAAIPEQHADSITEEQNTEGGGSVPPGSAHAGHTVRRRW
ncbi:MAG TPA: hypothetical protein VFI97_02105 [Arthrobacter sp.]|nr:hypothetical protein [Arthrobacter sp.]